MKSFFKIPFLVLALCFAVAHAEPYFSANDYTASTGGTFVTATVTNPDESYAVIQNIWFKSDSATPTIDIQRTPTTDNWQSHFQIFPTTTAVTSVSGYGEPLYVGAPGYSLRVVMNCDTQGAVLVGGEYK